MPATERERDPDLEHGAHGKRDRIWAMERLGSNAT